MNLWQDITRRRREAWRAVCWQPFEVEEGLSGEWGLGFNRSNGAFAPALSLFSPSVCSHSGCFPGVFRLRLHVGFRDYFLFHLVFISGEFARTEALVSLLIDPSAKQSNHFLHLVEMEFMFERPAHQCRAGCYR